MCGEVEFGKCDVCGKQTTLERTYYHYDIKCECHSPYHFELVRHCKGCIPNEPVETKITLKTKDLTKIMDLDETLTIFENTPDYRIQKVSDALKNVKQWMSLMNHINNDYNRLSALIVLIANEVDVTEQDVLDICTEFYYKYKSEKFSTVSSEAVFISEFSKMKINKLTKEEQIGGCNGSKRIENLEYEWQDATKEKPCADIGVSKNISPMVMVKTPLGEGTGYHNSSDNDWLVDINGKEFQSYKGVTHWKFIKQTKDDYIFEKMKEILIKFAQNHTFEYQFSEAKILVDEYLKHNTLHIA